MEYRNPIHGRQHQPNGSDPVAGEWFDIETALIDGVFDADFSFQNSWYNVGDPYPPMQYRKGATGLEFQGRIAGGASGSIAFVIQPDYLPFAKASYFMDTGDGTNDLSRFEVDATTGEVTVTIVGGSAGLPWILLYDGATTIPSGSYKPIPFSELTYDPDLVTQGDIFDWTTTDLGDTGNDRFQLQIRRNGWYYLDLVTEWDAVTDDGVNTHGFASQRIPFGTGDVIQTGFNQMLRSSADWPKNAASGDFEMLENTFLRTHGFIWLKNGATWKPEAIQTTGVDRGLSGITLFAIYYGTLLGKINKTDWTYESV